MAIKFKYNPRLVNQSELARISGLSQPYVNLLIKGHRKNEVAISKLNELAAQHFKLGK